MSLYLAAWKPSWSFLSVIEMRQKTWFKMQFNCGNFQHRAEQKWFMKELSIHFKLHEKNWKLSCNIFQVQSMSLSFYCSSYKWYKHYSKRYFIQYMLNAWMGLARITEYKVKTFVLLTSLYYLKYTIKLQKKNSP